ncbi:MAG: hypothetical protein LBS79_00270 [Tannerella sp.]|jgi:hypothetical protein|nr:hypothetical protein [Tannerella sp.]
MKKAAKKQQHVINFYRWSRKGYAVFCSIGRCVSIRRLKKNIVEASLKKRKSVMAVCFWESAEASGISVEDREEPDLPDISRQFLSVQALPQTATAVCDGLVLRKIGKQDSRLDAAMCLSGFFYDIKITLYNMYGKRD